MGNVPSRHAVVVTEDGMWPYTMGWAQGTSRSSVPKPLVDYYYPFRMAYDPIRGLILPEPRARWSPFALEIDLEIVGGGLITIRAALDTEYWGTGWCTPVYENLNDSGVSFGVLDQGGILNTLLMEMSTPLDDYKDKRHLHIFMTSTKKGDTLLTFRLLVDSRCRSL